jgi:hypothetical protein
MLKEYSDVISHMPVFEWHKRFMEDWEEVQDDERPGHPSTSKTEGNVERGSEIVDLKVKRLFRRTTWRSLPGFENKEEKARIVEEEIMDSATR